MPLYNDNNFDNHMLHYGYIKKEIYLLKLFKINKKIK